MLLLWFGFSKVSLFVSCQQFSTGQASFPEPASFRFFFFFYCALDQSDVSTI